MLSPGKYLQKQKLAKSGKRRYIVYNDFNL